MSFIKDKTRIRDQLLKAFIFHCFDFGSKCTWHSSALYPENAKLPPLSSTTDSSFPTTGTAARNYMFISNPWSLQPGARNEPKLSTPKVRKDGRQLFDENQGYNGPDRITAVMWITADMNVKDALDSLQMELEGKHFQIRWKASQKKNTKNQIVIYGLPPGFDCKGIMRELLYGLKESKKELCDGKRFTLDQNMACRDMLPFLNGYYNRTTPQRLQLTPKVWRTPSIRIRSSPKMGADCFISNMTLLTILGWMQFGTTSRRVVGANWYWGADQKYLSCQLLDSRIPRL